MSYTLSGTNVRATLPQLTTQEFRLLSFCSYSLWKRKKMERTSVYYLGPEVTCFTYAYSPLTRSSHMSPKWLQCRTIYGPLSTNFSDIYYFYFFKTGSYYVSQTGLELVGLREPPASASQVAFATYSEKRESPMKRTQPMWTFTLVESLSSSFS
jgi:hypothetical protein